MDLTDIHIQEYFYCLALAVALDGVCVPQDNFEYQHSGR